MDRVNENEQMHDTCHHVILKGLNKQPKAPRSDMTAGTNITAAPAAVPPAAAMIAVKIVSPIGMATRMIMYVIASESPPLVGVCRRVFFFGFFRRDGR